MKLIARVALIMLIANSVLSCDNNTKIIQVSQVDLCRFLLCA